ncbi:MAG: SRPBCC domain-containing protein [Candidatus Dormibacteria bacterium]
MSLVDRDGRTELTLHAGADSFGPDAETMLGGMRAGWNQSLRGLADLLRGTQGRQLVVSRLLPAPPDQVFEMWTNTERVGTWWGSKGCSISQEEMDVRPGGGRRCIVHGPDGVDHPNTFISDEVRCQEGVVYTHL